MTAPWKASYFGFEYDHFIRTFRRDNDIDVGTLVFVGAISCLLAFVTTCIAIVSAGGWLSVLFLIASIILFVAGLVCVRRCWAFHRAASSVSGLLLIDSGFARLSHEDLQKRSWSHLERRLAVLDLLKERAHERPETAAEDIADLKKALREEYEELAGLGILPSFYAEGLQTDDACKFRTRFQKSLL